MRLGHAHRLALGPAAVPPHQHEIGALGGQALSHRESNTHGAAGDDGNLAPQTQIHLVPLKSPAAASPRS